MLTVTVDSLPDEILLDIFSYLSCIQERFRLLRVCKRFQRLGLCCLKFRPYFLVKNSYSRGETEQNNQEEGLKRFPLRKILKTAPRLIKYYENPEIDANPLNEFGQFEPFNFRYLKKIRFELSHFGDNSSYEICLFNKLAAHLECCPNLETIVLFLGPCGYLQPTADDDYGWASRYTIPFSPNLKAFKAYINDMFAPGCFPNDLYNFFFGIINGQAPNLEKFTVALKHEYSEERNIITMLTVISWKCPNLRHLNLTYIPDVDGDEDEESDGESTDLVPQFGNDFNVFPQLICIQIPHHVMPAEFWSKLLSKCPVLKFLIFDPLTDRDMIKRLIHLHCPNVIYGTDDVQLAYEKFKNENKNVS